MFDFMLDIGNYDSRKVGRYDSDDLAVSTCSVSDGQKPFETAVRHLEYNDGKWVIVEMYDDEAHAQIGHDNWVKTMTSGNLPDYLRNCGNARIAQLIDAVGEEEWMIFPRQQ